jgi:hypothetical protein
MLRRQLNLLTALSLLLCVAVVVLWVRSYWRFDQFRRHWVDREGLLHGGRVVSQRGELISQGARLDERLASGELTGRDPLAYYPTATWRLLGFTAGRFRYRVTTSSPPSSPGGRVITGTATVLIVPHYAAALMTAAMPLAWAGREWKRRHTVPPGHCPRCGYDLRATPEKCPECGNAASVVSHG